jgi:hypothetical protein
MPESIRITDGSISFEGGIDSGRPPTLASESNPIGLKRNQVAWATNATMRGGAVRCRTGYEPVVQNVNWPGFFQGAFMYRPDIGYPYIVLAISGRIYRALVGDDNSVQEITTVPPEGTELDQFWFEQAEQFLVIQDGYRTPMIWDGFTMRRSLGIAGQEIDAGTCMDYYMGRLWMARGYDYGAGDIVFGPSGTAPYARRDAVLKWTENAYLAGGGLFTVPAPTSNIRALKHTANLNTALGQGELLIFTRDRIFAMDVPTNRTDWGALSQSGGAGSTYPQQRVAVIGDGTYGDRNIVHVNSDLHYRSTPGISSLLMAIRYFQQWGQAPMSREMNRVIQFDDRALLRFASGIEFDNRLYQTCLPTRAERGVYHKGIMVLDYDLVSSIGEKLPPAWEGMYEGLKVLQMVTGDFGGRQRAFAIVISQESGNIEIWEITNYQKRDNGDSRITWFVEFPAFTWNKPFDLKKLQSAEIWVDQLEGTVEFQAYYRPDQDPCWRFWHAWQECASRSCEEDTVPCVPEYPAEPYCAQYRATMILPEPPSFCEKGSGRPTDVAYQFQFKLVVKGWCRLRGLLLHAIERDEAPFDGMVC